MKGWKDNGHEVKFISQYAGKIEDYTYVRPVVMGYSKLFQIIYHFYVHVLARKNPNALDMRLKLGFPPMHKLDKCMKEFQPDLVIMRERSLYTICMNYLCRRHRYPSILYVMNPVWEKPKKKDLAHKLVWKLVPEFRITPSLLVGNRFDGLVKDDKAYFAPYLMAPMTGPEEKIYFRDGKIQILEIGKYQERKNHILMLKAFEKISRKYEVHLTIVGEVSNHFHEEYLERAKKFVKEHGLETAVTFKKNLNKEQMAQEYRDADLFVLPSTGEPGAVTMLEAMAYSVPAVCGDDNGTASYIEEGKTGYIFRDNDEADLIEKMEWIISDKENIPIMGKNAYRHVAEHFQFDSYFHCIEEIMERQTKEEGTKR